VTGLFQAPAHGRLRRGFAPDELAWLLRTSWVRTAGWTAHGGVVVAMLAQAIA
jgi:hypothetical protein